MANATEQLISIESACGGISILTTESAGGIWGAMDEIETWANIGRLELFRLRGKLVIGRQEEKAAVVVAFVDFLKG